MSVFNEYVPGRFTQPLAAARAEHARGRRVIGYLSDDIPVELILAADALPVRLESLPNMSTPLADQYLESSFSPAYRSYLEQWLRGELDFMDAVVFPRSNDSAQRLYYYISELQRRGVTKGPQPLIFDLARINRATSEAHTRAATATLAAELGVESLDKGCARLQQRVALARQLMSLRSDDACVAGSDVMQAWRALQLDWTESFEHTVNEWASIAARRSYQRRILLAGSTPPDDRLHRAAETAQANVVDENFDGALMQSVGRWAKSAPSFEHIAETYRVARTTSAAWLDSPALLVERARAVRANAVVLWLIEEDEGIVWEVPRQLELLREAGLPVLSLTRQQWNASPETLARVTRFAATGVDS